MVDRNAKGGTTMAQTETRADAPTDVAPQLFKLRTPLLSQGRLDTVLAETDVMQIRMKCYAAGGENALHAHPAEDHTFVVLAGQARFWGSDGEIATLGRNQGILLPRGCYYRFESCADEPLVLLRVGARTARIPVPRIAPDGHAIPGDSLENKTVPPIIIEGAFYE
jgi:mannose-6-phosphate isomerase-like protein (cupin superfamily)